MDLIIQRSVLYLFIKVDSEVFYKKEKRHKEENKVCVYFP